MPYLLEDLVIDRVDLVDEGANSEAFIELYKRKETTATMSIEEILSKMKPEHSAVIKEALDNLSNDVTKHKGELDTLTAEHEATVAELNKSKEDLATANSEIEVLKSKKPYKCECDGEADENGVCKECGKPKKAAFDEEETIKSMPADIKAMFAKMKAQKDAAEEELRKAKDAEVHSAAVAKAAELKALPIEKDKLVSVLKSCSSDMVEILTTINAAIEGTVLTEVGKNYTIGTTDAWSKIEAKADEIAKSQNVTKQKAISIAIKNNPELYKEYLQGGAN